MRHGRLILVMLWRLAPSIRKQVNSAIVDPDWRQR